MAKIYEAVSLRPDKLLGRINAKDGRIYDSTSGQDVFVGEVDYETNEVYDEDDYFIGWLEDNGEVYASYEGEDEDEDESERIGRVDDKGNLYVFTDDGESKVGSVTEMTNKLEAAAALLMFFGEDEEE